MDRKTTSVFCVVVIDNIGGETQRRYFDLWTFRCLVGSGTQSFMQ